MADIFLIVLFADPKVNLMSLTILALRVIFIKTIIFNIIMTLRLWISQCEYKTHVTCLCLWPGDCGDVWLLSPSHRETNMFELYWTCLFFFQWEEKVLVHRPLAVNMEPAFGKLLPALANFHTFEDCRITQDQSSCDINLEHVWNGNLLHWELLDNQSSGS